MTHYIIQLIVSAHLILLMFIVSPIKAMADAQCIEFWLRNTYNSDPKCKKHVDEAIQFLCTTPPFDRTMKFVKENAANFLEVRNREPISVRQNIQTIFGDSCSTTTPLSPEQWKQIKPKIAIITREICSRKSAEEKVLCEQKLKIKCQLDVENSLPNDHFKNSRLVFEVCSETMRKLDTDSLFAKDFPRRCLLQISPTHDINSFFTNKPGTGMYSVLTGNIAVAGRNEQGGCRSLQDLAGTIIHEITHFSADIHYNNCSTPFHKDNEEQGTMTWTSAATCDLHVGYYLTHEVEVYKLLRYVTEIIDSIDSLDQREKETIRALSRREQFEGKWFFKHRRNLQQFRNVLAKLAAVEQELVGNKTELIKPSSISSEPRLSEEEQRQYVTMRGILIRDATNSLYYNGVQRLQEILARIPQILIINPQLAERMFPNLVKFFNDYLEEAVCLDEY